jgi:hypothetical protein
MLLRQNSFRILGLFLVYSINSYASNISTSLENAVQVGSFPIGIGSTVNLQTPDDKLAGPAIFLGSTISPDGSISYQMYLNKASSKVYYIESTNFKRQNSKQQTILDPYQQAGGTCTGYAIDDFLQQTNLSGFAGNGTLANVLSTEEGRANLLVDSINEYYLTLSHKFSINGIMNSYGKKFGFACNSFKTDSYDKAKEKILSHLKLGLPIIVSFNIGPKMVKSPFGLEMYDQPNPNVDERLWIPRKTGERNSGGHSIVAAASFEMNKKTFLVMIDSDWSEPRIWDMDSFLNSKTALEEVEFISCK